MKIGFNSVFSKKKNDAENLDGYDGQKYERYLSFESREPNQAEVELEVEELNGSKYDKFYNEDGSTGTKLHEAFDSFDEAVFVDDKTRINFDELDNELATREYYK